MGLAAAVLEAKSDREGVDTSFVLRCAPLRREQVGRAILRDVRCALRDDVAHVWVFRDVDRAEDLAAVS